MLLNAVLNPKSDPYISCGNGNYYLIAETLCLHLSARQLIQLKGEIDEVIQAAQDADTEILEDTKTLDMKSESEPSDIDGGKPLDGQIMLEDQLEEFEVFGRVGSIPKEHKGTP